MTANDLIRELTSWTQKFNTGELQVRMNGKPLNIIAVLNEDENEYFIELIPKKKLLTCEDLEKEAEAYWKAQGGGSHAQWDKFRAVVKHFTEWQKRKMMKGAIPFYEILKAVPPGPARETTKLIIIKEDEGK